MVIRRGASHIRQGTGSEGEGGWVIHEVLEEDPWILLSAFFPSLLFLKPLWSIVWENGSSVLAGSGPTESQVPATAVRRRKCLLLEGPWQHLPRPVKYADADADADAGAGVGAGADSMDGRSIEKQPKE